MRYSKNTKILQIHNLKYAEFIIENSYLFNNENMTIEIGGYEIYKYMRKQISLRNIKVVDSIIIVLSIYDISKVSFNSKGEIIFKNNTDLKISKIKVFGDNANYYAFVTENENVFKIFYYNNKIVPSVEEYKFCNRDCNSYSLPSEYSEYSEETSWNNEEYKWVYDPQ